MGNLKFLINASNLHEGGGVQVAVSLIDELSRIEKIPIDVSILASDEVHANLRHMKSDCSRFSHYENFNTYGLVGMALTLNRKVQGFDVIFTIFGPLYLKLRRAVSIVGFARPWIIYPDNAVHQSLSLTQRIKTRMQSLAQLFFFRRADRLVVELEHVKRGLVRRNLYDAERIDVVHNCLSSLYFQPQKWKPLENEIFKKNYSIGFVGRDYLHKNTNILLEIKKILLDFYNLEVDFYVTLSELEWNRKSNAFRDNVYNSGVLDVAQCPSFYQKMDAVIFPSFLECFSATPLEAMAMKKPLFASDRDFVRDVCGDFAYYFPPENSNIAAELIANYINNEAGHDDEKLEAGRAHAVQFANARQRAMDYLEIMQAASESHAGI